MLNLLIKPVKTEPKYTNQIDHPTWKNRCLRPNDSPRKFGRYTENPSNIITRVIIEIYLILGIFFVFQRNKVNKGDKNNMTEGIPKIPCNFKGKGNNAAPQIENEKVKRRKIGVVFRPICLAVL